MPSPSRVLGPCLAFLALVAAPASAQSRLSPSGARVQAVQVATNPTTRSAVAFWVLPRGARSGALFATVVDGRRIGRPRRLARGAAAVDGRVAVTPNGTVVAVWTERRRGSTRLRTASARPRSLRFGRPATIARGNVRLSGLVAAWSNRVVAVWRSRTGVYSAVRAAVARAGRRFGRPQQLTRAAFTDPSVAGGPDGAVVAAWAEPAGASRTNQARAAVLPVGASRFRSDRSVSSEPNAAAEVSAAGGAGGLGVAWVGRGEDHVLRLALLAADGTVASEREIARVEDDASAERDGTVGVMGPAVGLPLGAPPLAAWLVSRPTSPGGRTAQSRPFAAAGQPAPGTAFGPTQELGTLPVPSSQPPLVAPLHGKALVFWPEATDRGVRLQVRAMGANGVLGGARTLASAGTIGKLAVARGGRRSIVAWVQGSPGRAGRLRVTLLR